MFIGAFGEIQWRNVSVDGISVEEAALTGRGQMQHLWGPFLLKSYASLRELHVAVGEVAEQERRYNTQTQENEHVYRYVRKLVQEGGPVNE